MSFHDWPGTLVARRALQRLVEGKPAFATPARGTIQKRARRAAINWLFENGYLERRAGRGGPIVTDAGRAEFAPRKRSYAYSDAEAALIRRLYPKLGATVLAERIGRTRGGVAKFAERNGIANKADFLQRCRDAQPHYRFEAAE